MRIKALLITLALLSATASADPLKAISTDVIGSAIRKMSPADQTYYDTLFAEFEQVTIENAVKWPVVRPTETTFNFTDAELLVGMAETNNTAVKLHPLFWYWSPPAWLTTKAATANAQDMRGAMAYHVEGMANQFAGRVQSIDVVNEAIADDGSGYRTGIWYDQIGSGWVDIAFRLAKAYFPTAKLYYNDYGAEDLGAKSNFQYSMLQGMIARGVPIDGVGLQFHHKLSDPKNFTDIEANVARLQALGLEVQFTEVDVDMENPTTMNEAQRLKAQANYYQQVFDLAKKKGIHNVTVWGYTDKYSWGNAAAKRCLFDDQYVKKPAYYAVQNALSP